MVGADHKSLYKEDGEKDSLRFLDTDTGHGNNVGFLILFLEWCIANLIFLFGRVAMEV